MPRTIVTIHGTGRTAHNFSVSQAQALAGHLGGPPRCHSVWWGDLIDVGAQVSRASLRLVPHLHTLAQYLIGRPARYTPRLVTRAADGLHRFLNGAAGVAAYLIPTRKRELIRERLRDSLAELTRRGHEIVLVSESLGCLIAFDVLRADADRYNIAAWYTLGCPLRTLVRTGQRSTDLGAINPQTVRQWVNLYAPRDPVAAPLADIFPAYPIRDVRLDGARDRLQAHRYWAHPRVAALIACTLRG